ncbi:uncharacterized protein Z520_12257 [Fonsecaea multimorphosa CBS 102226]|uniref:Uncharacterized protein n=1 Tax=Fonsecaea multimorphosa CBS 102226 TaxID=1442371 RepID=A0A0D2I409_9EURO|nr:uncharacterized protein Z520_12257 [Fonsecaea multimorphosa CBS 102226]KIX92041.1 hypothetical protein Z520_12257 [Fonsecaea multimorphosa CBS 102226]OAL17409.1 hypothetical protein AYO22_11690 [Fonsecaea multimorphosa]
MDASLTIFITELNRHFEVCFDTKFHEEFEARYRRSFDQALGSAFEPRFQEIGEIVWNMTREEVRARISDDVQQNVYRSIGCEVLRRLNNEVGDGVNYGILPRLQLSPEVDEAIFREASDGQYDTLLQDKFQEVYEEKFAREFRVWFIPAFDEAFVHVFDKNFDVVFAAVALEELSKVTT